MKRANDVCAGLSPRDEEPCAHAVRYDRRKGPTNLKA